MMSDWSCIEYLKKIQNDEILGSQRTFSSEVLPEVEHINRKAKSTPYILSFWSKFQLKKWGSYINGTFKIWLILWPHDLVIRPIFLFNELAGIMN